MATPLFTEEDYLVAIKSLEQSTRAIETHIESAREVLESSKRQLQSHTSKHVTSKPRAALQKKQYSRLIDASRTHIIDECRNINEEINKSTRMTLIEADDTLCRHDYQFTLIEQELEHFKGSDSPNTELEKAKALLAVLQTTRAEIIRVKLNRLYLRSLHRAPVEMGYKNGQVSHETRVVEEDLRALHDEIQDVATILAMHEYGDLLNDCDSTLKENRDLLYAHKSQQALQQVDRMTTQVDTLTDRVKCLQSHQLLQQGLSVRLKSLDSSQPSRISAPLESDDDMSTDRKIASLTALRQYLGLSSGSFARYQRRTQANTDFQELLSHSHAVLETQAEQNTALGLNRGYEGTHDSEHNATRHNILDELDHSIAMIKSRMDALPT